MRLTCVARICVVGLLLLALITGATGCKMLQVNGAPIAYPSSGSDGENLLLAVASVAAIVACGIIAAAAERHD